MQIVLKSIKYSFLFILLVCTTKVAFCQNLVKNPSLEEYINCPSSLGSFGEDLENWSAPTLGTTDYFNTCSSVMSVPKNFNGTQDVKFGNGYAGLYFYAPADYREYIQVNLKRTLTKDRNYQISFYISLAEDSDFAISDFEVVLAYRRVEISTKKTLSKGKLHRLEGNKFHAFSIKNRTYFTDKKKWIKINTSFKAKGYERYLIIGNLKENKATKKKSLKEGKAIKGAYYYIDMVSLVSEDEQEEFEVYELDQTYIFKNVYFEFDKYNLDAVAEASLERMYNYLMQNPTYKIAIRGHTDSKGSDDYNKKLSGNRAKEIANRLIQLGINGDRVTYTNHGSAFPVAENSTEEGRKKNRRG